MSATAWSRTFLSVTVSPTPMLMRDLARCAAPASRSCSRTSASGPAPPCRGRCCARRAGGAGCCGPGRDFGAAAAFFAAAPSSASPAAGRPALASSRGLVVLRFVLGLGHLTRPPARRSTLNTRTLRPSSSDFDADAVGLLGRRVVTARRWRRGSACPCRRCRRSGPSSGSGAGASSRG
mgnify:CR=1 FL=1